MNNKIKEIRKGKGMTQKTLAKNSKVSLSYISKLEVGLRKTPGLKYANRIASALETTIQDLFSYDESN